MFCEFIDTPPDERKNMEDLVELVNMPYSSNPRCVVTIKNSTPCAWEVTILSGGVKFFYRNNKDYTDGPRPINLGCNGASTQFQSHDPNQCVFQIFAAIVVQVKGEEPKTYTARDDAGEGKCLYHISYDLGPTATLDLADGRRVSAYDLISLKSITPL